MTTPAPRENAEARDGAEARTGAEARDGVDSRTGAEARDGVDSRTGGRPNLLLRLAAVLVGTLLIWLAMGQLTGYLEDRLPRLAVHTVNAVFVFVLAVPLVVAARRYLDRRPWSGLALGSLRTGWWPLLVGLLAWLVPAAAGLAVVLGAGWASVTVVATAGELLLAVLLLIGLVFVFEAFPEELIFRGYAYRNLGEAGPVWLAVTGQALLFTLFGFVLWATSNGWAAAADQAVIFLFMGVVLGVIRWLAGSVWACVGYHLAFQVVAQLLLGGWYAEVRVEGEETLTMVAFGGAFLLGPLVAALLLRVRPTPDSQTR